MGYSHLGAGIQTFMFCWCNPCHHVVCWNTCSKWCSWHYYGSCACGPKTLVVFSDAAAARMQHICEKNDWMHCRMHQGNCQAPAAAIAALSWCRMLHLMGGFYRCEPLAWATKAACTHVPGTVATTNQPTNQSSTTAKTQAVQTT